MNEAMFFKTEENTKKVTCFLCPKDCVIADGKTGVCGVRQNINGTFISLVYEKPVAIHIDPIEKKPLYHFHPGSKILSIGTYGCNLSCRFCQNYDISQIKDSPVDFDNIKRVTSAEIVNMCIERGLKFIAFTYNEPTIFYEYMYETAILCKEHDIKTVVVSNGQINEEPLKKLIPYIDAFNIDLKAFNENFYKKICNGDFETTKNTLRIIAENKKHLEVTFLLIEGFNDDLHEFIKMCKFLKRLDNKIVLHISRAFPRYKLNFNPTPKSLMNLFFDTAGEYLENVYMGNV
ncbi:MAG: AmmeMemoRadiSam system radical SAM enzyme [Ignavibacteria bacterium]|nr:AmmeMemoRadiSam system radical SAM enzyme [Ignavibacteria bacterium]